MGGVNVKCIVNQAVQQVPVHTVINWNGLEPGADPPGFIEEVGGLCVVWYVLMKPPHHVHAHIVVLCLTPKCCPTSSMLAGGLC